MGVTVIGGGAAGAVAALAARAGGAAVELRSRGWGATALSSGAIDLAGDPAEVAGDPWAGRPCAARNFAEMLRRNPRHPLRHVREAVASALGRFCDHVPLYRPRPLDAPDLILPTDLGTWKSTFLAQGSQTAAHLPALAGKRVVVFGFRGWAGFAPKFLAASLWNLARRGGIDCDLAVGEVGWLEDDPFLALREPHELARTLDEPGAAERLGENLAAVDADLLLRPPVLGLSTVDVADRIAGAAGVPVAEPLASDRSVPGIRLQMALDRALFAAGVKRSNATQRPPGPAVLATGGFIGGGIVRGERELREALFDLPVVVPGAPGSQLSGPDVGGPHPYLSAGVPTDERLRPDGGPPGLFAAGAVLGGYDAIRERCGLGAAIVTGHVAGTLAAEIA